MGSAGIWVDPVNQDCFNVLTSRLLVPLLQNFTSLSLKYTQWLEDPQPSGQENSPQRKYIYVQCSSERQTCLQSHPLISTAVSESTLLSPSGTLNILIKSLLYFQTLVNDSLSCAEVSHQTSMCSLSTLS